MLLQNLVYVLAGLLEIPFYQIVGAHIVQEQGIVLGILENMFRQGFESFLALV